MDNVSYKKVFKTRFGRYHVYLTQHMHIRISTPVPWPTSPDGQGGEHLPVLEPHDLPNHKLELV